VIYPNPPQVEVANATFIVRKTVVVPERLNLSVDTGMATFVPAGVAMPLSLDGKFPRSAVVVETPALYWLIVVVPAVLVATHPTTSQSPAVRLMDVTFAVTPFERPTALPTAIFEVIISPMYPAAASLLVVVPVMSADTGCACKTLPSVPIWVRKLWATAARDFTPPSC